MKQKKKKQKKIAQTLPMHTQSVNSMILSCVLIYFNVSIHAFFNVDFVSNFFDPVFITLSINPRGHIFKDISLNFSLSIYFSLPLCIC